MEEQNKKMPPYQPWTENIGQIAIYTAALVASYFFLLRKGHTIEFVIVAVIQAILIYEHFTTLSSRRHGQAVERKALSALKKLAGDNLRENVMTRHLGDVDGVLLVNGKLFNIEIKSVTTARKVTTANIRQARKQSHAIQSHPIVWLPESKRNFTTVKEGMQIIGGNATYLLGVLN